MPRPKRSKVAPSAPIALPHLTQPAVASAAQKQRDIFSPASSGRVTTTSDDSDGLVVSKKTGARGNGFQGQEYTMSGALAPEDIGSTRLKPPSNQTRLALSKIAREADYARKVAEVKIKTRRDAAQTGAATETEQIPSSIPTELVPAPKPSPNSMGITSATKGTQVSLGSRISETPRPQPSMLGATFKKRPRQPSLLQVLQTQNDPSENLDDDELDDFHPDDESTPMIKSMSQTNAQHASSSSRQTSGSRKRKLATPEIQVPASQTRDPPSSPPSGRPQEQEDVYDLPAEEEEVRPEPTLPQPRTVQTAERQIDSDTLAPPQSSSPEKPKPRKTHAKPTKAATTRPPQTRRKDPSLAPPSPLSSTTTSTNPSSPVKPAPLKPLTTATLQNLLPRRRRGRPIPRSEYDIPSSSSDIELDTTALGEDEDELSFHATTTTMKMRRKKKIPNPTSMPSKRAGIKWKGKGKGKEAPAPAPEKKRISRTYTKKTTTTAVLSSDENDDDDDVGSDVENDARNNPPRTLPPLQLDAKAMHEMRRLAEKFREVDEYSLEFEDLTTGSSQMRDAR